MADITTYKETDPRQPMDDQSRQYFDNLETRARTSEPGVTDHLSELTSILERIQQYQQAHANLLADNPTVDAYWHAGQQIVSAALMLKSAVDMVRQGKAQ